MNDVTIELTISTGYTSSDVVAYRMTYTAREWDRMGMNPLPNAWDSGFDIDATCAAIEQRQVRQTSFLKIAETFTNAIANYVHQRDPSRGYGKPLDNPPSSG